MRVSLLIFGSARKIDAFLSFQSPLRDWVFSLGSGIIPVSLFPFSIGDSHHYRLVNLSSLPLPFFRLGHGLGAESSPLSLKMQRLRSGDFFFSSCTLVPFFPPAKWIETSIAPPPLPRYQAQFSSLSPRAEDFPMILVANPPLIFFLQLRKMRFRSLFPAEKF